LPLGISPSGEKCKDKVRKWQLKHFVNESDSSMLHEEKNTWAIIVENFRVRKVDTSFIATHGICVPLGIKYQDILIECKECDPSIDSLCPHSLEAARQVLKYVMVIGHIWHMPNTSQPDKIECVQKWKI
jgi:hypothetical protein